MARGISLRSDFTDDDLRALARSSKDAKQARRLLALSLIYDAGTRSDAARHGGVGLQTIRDWVLRFNADGPEGLMDGKSTGAPPRLTPEQKVALARVVEDGPTPYLDGVVRWRLCDLVSWLHETFDVTLDMGYRKLTARPRHHAGDQATQDAFKKTFQPLSRRSASACRQEHR